MNMIKITDLEKIYRTEEVETVALNKLSMEVKTVIRNIYLSVSALVFAILSSLIVWQGATFIYAYLIALDWTVILFTGFVVLAVIAALIFTNKWVVLGSKSPIISLWLDLKQLLSKITWDIAYKIMIWGFVTVFATIFTIGCFVSYSKINQYNSDLHMSGQWYKMYLDRDKDYKDLKQLYDEQSIDYASAVNTIKTHFYAGERDTLKSPDGI
jgi:hypothetical protein